METFAQRVKDAEEWFKDHQVHRDVDVGWVFKKPGTANLMTHVIVLGGYVTLNGDIDLCSFAGCHSDKHSALEWVANFDCEYYAHQKASIGMSERQKTFNYDVARKDLKEIIDSGFYTGESLEKLNEVFDLIEDCASEGEITHAIFEATDDVSRYFGTETSQNVVVALAACRQLYRVTTGEEPCAIYE
jgi:hypothetical protein